MVTSAELPGAVPLLQPGLDCLVKQEVRAPRAARRDHVGRDPPVQAPHALRPHYRGHGVAYRGVFCPPLESVIHGKPSKTRMTT